MVVGSLNILIPSSRFNSNSLRSKDPITNGAIAVSTMSRRRFLGYGVASATVAGIGLIAGYFLTRSPEPAPSEEKLPPGQQEVEALQVLHVGAVPNVPIDKWTFEVDGEVANPLRLSWKDFVALPKTDSVSEFHCVTGWTKLNNSWEGVKFKEIAKLAQPSPRAKYATIECYGDVNYTTSLPLGYLMRDDVLFAYGLDGKPLEPKYGGPLRLVAPSKYGYKSAKWVKRVKLTEKKELGYWETRGYSDTADPWTNDRFAYPLTL